MCSLQTVAEIGPHTMAPRRATHVLNTSCMPGVEHDIDILRHPLLLQCSQHALRRRKRAHIALAPLANLQDLRALTAARRLRRCRRQMWDRCIAAVGRNEVRADCSVDEWCKSRVDLHVIFEHCHVWQPMRHLVRERKVLGEVVGEATIRAEAREAAVCVFVIEQARCAERTDRGLLVEAIDSAEDLELWEGCAVGLNERGPRRGIEAQHEVRHRRPRPPPHRG